MPFWKKSEDPWDMEPGNAGLEEQEPLPLDCPWCGKPMVRGYLDAVKGGNIWWVTRRPDMKAALIGADPKSSLLVDDEGGIFLTYKTAWRCTDCEKMILDTAGMKRPYETPFGEAVKTTEETQE